jgi:hypothetical protein
MLGELIPRASIWLDPGITPCVKKAHIGRPAERRLHLIAERKTFLESIL